MKMHGSDSAAEILGTHKSIDGYKRSQWIILFSTDCDVAKWFQKRISSVGSGLIQGKRGHIGFGRTSPGLKLASEFTRWIQYRVYVDI
jgi:hypothetical protein